MCGSVGCDQACTIPLVFFFIYDSVMNFLMIKLRVTAPRMG